MVCKQSKPGKKQGGPSMLRSGNPALQGDVFRESAVMDSSEAMSVSGTVNKSFFMLILLVFSASFVWSRPEAAAPFLFPSVILGFIVALVTIFKKEYAPVTAPIYALVQGVVLGTISSFFEMRYPGIVIQAVGLTISTLFCMLFAYKTGIIKVTEKFKLGVVAATGSIAILYLASILMGFFGANIGFIHSSGPVGIGFSVFVVIIAALNLVMDFDLIEKGAEFNAPKYMEWYAAFALMVTLIWLYLEILRLLSKTRSR
jgi:uncharacterized YccA/Bax inhibitor family protein